jgi:putative hemolysin
MYNFGFKDMENEDENGVKPVIWSKVRVAGLSKLLMGALKLDRIGKLHDSFAKKTDLEFIDLVIEELGISLEFFENELAHIPKNGSFITVSNHPLGGIDGLLLIKLISKVRPDVKVMANFLLTSVDQLNQYFLPLDPLDSQSDLAFGGASGKSAVDHLQEGGALGLFPSGEVSAYNLRSKSVRDRIWKSSALRFIKGQNVQVVPVFFKANNSLLFHLLALLNPRLKVSNLQKNIFSKRDRVVSVRIGRPISLADQNEFEDIHEYGRFLRVKTYLLGVPIKVKPFFRPVLFKKKWKEVVLPQDPAAIEMEVKALREAGALLYENKEYQVFFTDSESAPNILYEIGRLREITFREVGEGTGKNIDLDQFDLYYRHLFVWDTEHKKVVGAYRLGMGKEIMQRYGKRGFYLNSLFSFQKGFNPIFSESIELGRSFVIKEYQLKPLPLFLLWKGILYFILKNPDYRYLIGPVSISGEFSNISKYLIIAFIQKYYFDKELAAYVKPRNEYIPDIDPESTPIDILSKTTKEDLKKLDKMIDEIELGHFRLPALLKKYLGQNGKIIGFNVDPKFNNALDGLLIMDLFSVPTDTIEGLSKEMNDKDILQKFTSNG